DRRPAVARPRDVEHVEVVLLDDAVQVHVDEVLPGCRPPVAEEARLHVRGREWRPQQRVVVEIDLADREIVGRAPIRVDPAHEIRGEWARHDGSPSFILPDGRAGDSGQACSIAPFAEARVLARTRRPDGVPTPRTNTSTTIATRGSRRSS